jgi:GNAT superfamily N-acetyltransferase
MMLNRKTLNHKKPKLTVGAQLVPAKFSETLRLLQALHTEDLLPLDEELGAWMNRPLGREALAGVVLPTSGSTYLSLLNFEPAGLICVERGEMAGRIRALAVASDMRRRGIARTMLTQLETIVQESGLEWLWMSIPNDNEEATRCALQNGYRRYRPQFLRRERASVLPLSGFNAHLVRLDETEAMEQLMRWIEYESNVGDEWAAAIAQGDLLSRFNFSEGEVYLIYHENDEVGLAKVEMSPQPFITFWLQKNIWNTDAELSIFKSVVDTMREMPLQIGLAFGSHDHLRASIGRYKKFDFKPMLFERVNFLKRIRSD